MQVSSLADNKKMANAKKTNRFLCESYLHASYTVVSKILRSSQKYNSLNFAIFTDKYENVFPTITTTRIIKRS